MVMVDRIVRRQKWPFQIAMGGAMSCSRETSEFPCAVKLCTYATHNLVILAVMAEWLRRWTRNPMGYSRAGSNPVHSEAGVFLAPPRCLHPQCRRGFKMYITRL